MRVFDDMTEIVLDVPNAYHVLSKFVERCLAAGFLSSVIAEQIPQRLVHLGAGIFVQCVHTQFYYSYMYVYFLCVLLQGP